MSEVIIPDLPGGQDSREVFVLRKQTEKFIQENPSQITLLRETRIPNGKGGYTTTRAPQASQTFRIVPQQPGSAARTMDGDKVAPTFVLIGRWNADVNNNDVFEWDGRTYSVDLVRGSGLSTSYETWVEVTYSG